MAASARFGLAHVRVKVLCLTTWLRGNNMVERDGFEPSNPKGTDLQSVAFSHFATSPTINNKMVPKPGIEPGTY